MTEPPAYSIRVRTRLHKADVTRLNALSGFRETSGLFRSWLVYCIEPEPELAADDPRQWDRPWSRMKQMFDIGDPATLIKPSTKDPKAFIQAMLTVEQHERLEQMCARYLWLPSAVLEVFARALLTDADTATRIIGWESAPLL